VLHLTAEMLRAHRFPFPPPDEQREIVERLDASLMHIGKIVIAASEVVRRLREYRQALITAAVTGKLDISTSTSSAATMPALEGAE
jgi:type I restriction enzyme S subunit